MSLPESTWQRRQALESTWSQQKVRLLGLCAPQCHEGKTPFEVSMMNLLRFNTCIYQMVGHGRVIFELKI